MTFFKPMSAKKLVKTLTAHRLWVNDEPHGQRMSLLGANLRGHKLVACDLYGAQLLNSSFNGVNLLGTDLRRALLDGCDFRHASLKNAKLQGASINGADFTFAYVNGAVLSEHPEWGDITAVALCRSATRSDGYTFYLWDTNHGFYVQAGCRFLDWSESKKHWRTHRRKLSIPNLHEETQDILAFFSRCITRHKKKNSK